MKWPKLTAIGCVGLAVCSCGDKGSIGVPRISEYASLDDYISALNSSTDPQAVAIRKEIADGPVDLAAEKAECLKYGVPVTLSAASVPSAKDAYPLYKKWSELADKKKVRFPPYADPLRLDYRYSPAELSVLSKIVNDNPEVFDLLHQAAAQPSVTTTSGYYAAFSKLRAGARTLDTEGFLLARSGNYSKAVECGALGLNAAKQASRCSNQEGYVTAVTVESIALSSLQNILTMAGPNPNVDSQVAATLSNSLPILSLRRCLAGETPIQLDLLDNVRTFSPTDFIDLIQLGNTATSPKPVPASGPSTTSERTFIDNVTDAAEAQYLKRQLLAIKSADLPFLQQKPVLISIDTAESVGASNPVQEEDPVSMLLTALPTSPYVITDESGCNDLAREQVILAAAAVLGAKAQIGRYPDKLPGKYMDPYAGRSLGYRRLGSKGFLIYSVGNDGLYRGDLPATSHDICYSYPPPPATPIPSDLLRIR